MAQLKREGAAPFAICAKSAGFDLVLPAWSTMWDWARTHALKTIWEQNLPDKPPYLASSNKFPLDALKIDRSFVRQLSTAADETTVLTAIIDIGRSLKLRVVAEGVETEEDLAFLQAHHCDEAQGYYLSRPVPPEQFAKLLQSGLSRAP
ncbi:MAG: EAL domain-containing protein, partial [Candidatus Acidiferrales bacterium]